MVAIHAFHNEIVFCRDQRHRGKAIAQRQIQLCFSEKPVQCAVHFTHSAKLRHGDQTLRGQHPRHEGGPVWNETECGQASSTSGPGEAYDLWNGELNDSD